MGSDWRSRAKPVKLDIQGDEAAPKSDWRSRAKPVAPPVAGPSPVAPAPQAPPEEPGFFERIPESLDRAAVNMLEGVTFGGAGAVAPYVNAAIDEINPFTESKDFRDRVKERKAQWDSKVDPVLSAAASLPMSGPLKGVGLAGDLALNGLMSLRNQELQGKDLSDPDNLVDAGQSTAVMSLAPPVVGELGRTVMKSLEPLKPLAGVVRKGANRMASRAVGLTKAQLNNLPIDAPDTMGAKLNEKGILSIGDTAESIAPKIAAEKATAGEAMGDVLRTADAQTGGSGAEIRAVTGNRQAMDAQERVKDALRRKALEARIGANASMGRSRLEALEAAAKQKQDVLSNNQLTQVQDLVSGISDDVARATEKRGDVKTAVENTLLFDAGKLDERQLAQADEARSFADAVRKAMSETERQSLAPEGSLGYLAAKELDVRSRIPGMVPDRIPDTSAVVPPPDALGETVTLASLPPQARPEAAGRFADEFAKANVPVPSLVDEVASRAGALPDRVPSDLAAREVAEKFGGPVADRPETFAAAGEGSKTLLKSYTDDATKSTMPPVDPRSFSEGLGFDAHKFVDRARQELLPALSDPALSGLKAKTERLLAAYEKRANQGMSFSEGNKMKSVLQSTIRKFQDAKADQKVKLDLQRMIDDALEDQLQSVVGSDKFRQFVKAKGDYGVFANAGKANNQLIRKEAGNMPVGLVELMSGGAGAGTGALIGNMVGGGPAGAALGAVAGPLAARGIRTHGPAAAAASLNGVARYLEAPGQLGTALKGLGGGQITTEAVVRALGPEKANQFFEWLKSQGPGEDK